MSSEQVLLSGILYAISLIIFVMGIFSLMKMKTPGVMTFGLLLIASAVYVGGYAMELMSSTLGEVDLWSKVQYIALPFIPAVWVVLSIEYCKVRKKFGRLFYFFLFLIPLITFIFRYTSDLQPWYYRNMELVSNGSFNVLVFDKGPWYYVQIIYSILCVVFATANYLIFSKRVVALMRRQATIMAVASIMPVLALFLNIAQVAPYGIDVGPFALLFDYSLFMFGMYRYNMLSLVPIAREKVFDWIQDGVLVLDMELRVIDMNLSVKKIFPQLLNQRYGVMLNEIIPDHAELIKQIENWNQDTNISQNLLLEFNQDIPDDKNYFYQLKLTKLFEGTVQIGVTIIISDISSTKTLMDQLVNLARVDSMTGLMNRRYFFERVEYEVERANRKKSTFSFIFFDLDNFKLINDQYGHAAGDDMIVYVSEICRKQLRSIDLFTRFGGDEFIIYLPDCDRKNAVEVAERLRISIQNEPVEYAGQWVQLSASFGVESHDVTLQGDCSDVNVIFRAADEAMYVSKRNGKNSVSINAELPVTESLFNWKTEDHDPQDDTINE
ncbi:MAG: histidine kinase N-terminal 7TM domain-containing protein [Erysipelotrichaceae bacterium]